MGIKESIKRKRDEKNEVGGIRTHDKMVFGWNLLIYLQWDLNATTTPSMVNYYIPTMHHENITQYKPLQII
jgi:hypothetical protein